MQDQSEGERYVVQSFDAHMWSIADTATMQVYVLMLVPFGNFTVQLSLVELVVNSENPSYLVFLSEIMSGTFGVSNPQAGTELAHYVLRELNKGHDVANPVNIAARLGADLHGQRVEWPPLRAN
jgi:hypothetical protein